MSESGTLWGLLDRAARLFPKKGFVLLDNGPDQPGTRVTYAQLHEQARTNGALLQEVGLVHRGEVVLMYFDTHGENIIWFWSIIAAGGVPAILSPLSNHSKTAQGQLENLERLFSATRVITTQWLEVQLKGIRKLQICTTQQLSKMTSLTRGLAEPTADDARHPDSLAALIFTSGSTGHSKAIEFSHRQLISSAKAKSTFHHITSETTFMSWVSFDHSANFCEIHLNAMHVGSDQLQVPAIDLVTKPAYFFHLLSDYQIGYTFLPNSFLAAATTSFLAQKDQTALDFGRLKVIMCGGEANRTSTLEAADRILTRFGARPYSIKAAYGLSETCSACFYNTRSPQYDSVHEYTFASVGKPLPRAIESRIVDDYGAKRAAGTNGKLQLRGEIVFQRYYNDEAATSSCMTADGWFDTGDLGVEDEHGNLRIIGRSKEIIIINGNNYSSFELEHAIETSLCDYITPSFVAAFSTWTQNSDSETIVILFNPSDAVSDFNILHNIICDINRVVVGFCMKSAHEIIALSQDMMPKSTIGKLSRAKLKKQYEAGDFDRYRMPTRLPTGGNRNCPNRQATNGIATNGLATNGLATNGITTNGAATEAAAVDEAPGTTSNNMNTFPASQMQAVIAEVIAEELGMRPDSMTSGDVLSVAGVDSLRYLRIKTGLEAALRMEQSIPMPLLLQCRSIKDVEQALLSIGTAPPEYDPIVPLAHGGSKTPLFLCHPGGGEVLIWLTLLKFLPDRPIYALRVRGHHLHDRLFESFDEMFSCYVAGIRKRQPHGPYALLGLSFGTLLAFELGKRLEAAGEEVKFIGGIDVPPDLKQIVPKQSRRQFLLELLRFHSIGSEEEALSLENELQHVSDKEFYQEVFDHFRNSGLQRLNLTVAYIERWGTIVRTLHEMVRGYEPTGSVSTFDLFWVPPMRSFNVSAERWRTDYLAAWANHCKTEVRFHRIEGEHSTIMREPHVRVFQAALNKAMAARDV